MSRKKALSLLLAVSMVFSMNAIAFAEETSSGGTEETVEVESQVSSDSAEATYSENTQSINGSSTKFNGKADMMVTYDSNVRYTGKTIKATDLNITVSVDGYVVNAKTIKITGSKKNTSTGNTFKIKSIDTNYKKIKYNDPVGSTSANYGKCVYDTKSSEEIGKIAAKAALKAVKKSFNTYLKKSSDNSFDFNIKAVYISDNSYVTYKSLKSLKVSGNSYAFNTYDKSFDNTAVVKINNNGKVTGVYILAKGSERTNGTCKVRKIKLKKNTDYKITNSVITFDGTNINYTTGYDLTKLGAASGQNT